MKAYTIGAKRRSKRMAFDLPTTPPRKKKGRARMAEIKADPEASRPTLAARCRHANKPDTPENRTAMRDPAMGEAAGRALRAFNGGKHNLWPLWVELTAARARYLKLDMGATIHPIPARWEAEPGETLEVRPDDRPDLRSDDEKVRAARNAWLGWKAALLKLEPYQRRAVEMVLDGRQPDDLLFDGLITSRGMLFARSLLALANVRNAGPFTSENVRL